MAEALHCIGGMRWDRGHQSEDIEDRRASSGGGFGFGGGGGGVPLGGIFAVASRFGIKGVLVALLLIGVMTYGGGLCGGSRSAPDQGVTTPSSRVTSQEERGAGADEMVRFVGFVLDDVQATFRKQVRGYQTAKLVLFRNQVASACGSASTAVGPFYCPLDRKVYVDLAFYDELRERFGAPGDFAQAYVIAHEIGHHVQNLSGRLGRGEVHQIETELGADCLAGAWAQDAERRQLVEVGDVDEALNAAAQIGDDTIQRKTQGRVQPETWTHGSAAQRSGSFKKGYRGGVAACL